MICAETRQTSASSVVSFIDRLARRIVANRLSTLSRGEIRLSDAGGAATFGQQADLQATLRVHRSRLFRQAVVGGTLSVAEAYVRGDWDCDDLTALFRIFVRNRESADRLDRGAARIVGFAHQLVHRLRSNSPSGSRRNIAAHYDLGNEFYRLWLDDTLAYSSGIFPSPGALLEAASVEKFDRVCRKLDLCGRRTARNRHWLGRLRTACGIELRLSRDDDHHLRPTVPNGARAH